MRKNISSKLLIVLCLLALYSCKSKKLVMANITADTTAVVDTSHFKTNTQTSVPIATPNIVNPPMVPNKPAVDNFKLEKLKAIRLKQVDFNTFSGKAQAKLNVNGDAHDVTLNVRIKKGQQIWVSITAVLGVEVARALITPDSIKIMNRLESTYLKKPFSYVYAYTSKQINYKTLESIIIGNAITELVSDNAADMKADKGNVIISGTLQDLVYDLTVGPDLRVTQTNMSNQSAGQSLHVVNADLVQVATRVMPSRVNINSTVGAKAIQADIHYTKAEFDPNLSYPFSVPARFKLVD